MLEIVKGHEIWVLPEISHTQGHKTRCRVYWGRAMCMDGLADLNRLSAWAVAPSGERLPLKVEPGDDRFHLVRFTPNWNGFWSVTMENQEDLKEDLKMCMELTLWESVVKFHGHTCPGLAIGFRVAQIALRELFSDKIPLEKRWAIVESGSCCCGIDAIQLLVGCTTGKGNLMVKDWGKEVYIFGISGSQEALRVVVKKNAWPDNSFWENRRRVMAGEAEPAEIDTFYQKRTEVTNNILGLPEENLCTLSRVKMVFPAKKQDFQLVDCPSCGEPVQKRMLVEGDGKMICRSCYEQNHSAQ